MIRAEGSLAPASMLVSLLAKLLEMQSRTRGETELCGQKLEDNFLTLTNCNPSQLQTGPQAVIL